MIIIGCSSIETSVLYFEICCIFNIYYSIIFDIQLNEVMNSRINLDCFGLYENCYLSFTNKWGFFGNSRKISDRKNYSQEYELSVEIWNTYSFSNKILNCRNWLWPIISFVLDIYNFSGNFRNIKNWNVFNVLCDCKF